MRSVFVLGLLLIGSMAWAGPAEATPPWRIVPSDLIVPSEAFVGQAVEIGANLTNPQDQNGTALSFLLVDGRHVANLTAFIPAGETTAIAFSFVPERVGPTWVTIRLATGESLSGRSMNVTEAPTTVGDETRDSTQSPEANPPAAEERSPISRTTPNIGVAAVIVGAILACLWRRNG